MKHTSRNWGFLLLTGVGLTLPNSGAGVGHIIVYALDSSSIGSPPPSTTATLNGSNTLSFGSNSYITFSNLTVGTHTVEVTTASSGYLPRENPDTSNAVNDPDSAYGNPRHISVEESGTTLGTFRFDPVITLSATIRDAWTMERLESAPIACVFEGSTGSVSICKYPSTAAYATNWTSSTSGTFLPQPILYLHDYDLEVTPQGYPQHLSSNVITDASPGDTFDLGNVFVYPPDSNTNQIDDLWETIYFGTSVDATADADGDRMCNRDEYIAGTDPTNALSCLNLTSTLVGDDMEFSWSTESWRTYRIIGTTDLNTGTWMQVAGPWEATNGQFSMSWTETNLNLSWQSSYCVEVVPCDWIGTNHVLVRTNNWPTGGGSGGGSTNLPPLP